MFVLTIFLAFVFFGIGYLIFWRKSDDWMALLFAFGLILGGTASVILTVGVSHSVWQLPILFVGELLILSFFLAFALFPNGRFVPGWTRWLFVAVSVLSVVLAVLTFFINLFTVPLWAAIPLILLICSLYASLVIAQIYRYRYVSSLVQRQQTKWVISGLTAIVVVFASGFFPTLIFPRSLYPLAYKSVLTFTTSLVPLAIGIAILRYRLWDIDILINRTLVYGMLTISLVLIYIGLVIGLGELLRLFTGQLAQSPVVIIASTLAIVALFQPLRHRLQQFIDRRFYRSKYDAAKTVAAFSATLRSEADLTQLSEQFLAVVQETMQPTFVSLWVRPPAHHEKHRVPWRATPLVSPGKDEERKGGGELPR